MSLNVTLSFPKSANASAALAEGCKVVQYTLREVLGGMSELLVRMLSSNSALCETDFVGEAVTTDFGDEPLVKSISGLVSRFEQRTAVPGGDSEYELVVVPPVWLLTRCKSRFIFQDKTVLDIVRDCFDDYEGAIPAPALRLQQTYSPREYCVQMDETDWQFITRVLAEEGIAWMFDHANGSVFTLLDDTTKAAELGSAVSYRDRSAMNQAAAGDANAVQIVALVAAAAVTTPTVKLRDYDFRNPAYQVEGKVGAPEDEQATNEKPLWDWSYAEGLFTDENGGDALATRRLEALRVGRRIVRCLTTFGLPAGAKLTITDHPVDERNGDYLVLACYANVAAKAAVAAIPSRAYDDGHKPGSDEASSERALRPLLATSFAGTSSADAGPSAGGAALTREHELVLMPLVQPFRPSLRARPRVAGTHTAFVVGAEGQEIDLDEHGRVEVEFRWDRRDIHAGGTSRRIRVAQAWAGLDRGLVLPPRIGDEVIVAYVEGDPEQPLMVGSVHNGANRSPLNLPGDGRISVWRSRSTPGGGGYNQILLDDAAGAERLEIHAQRDFKSETGHNSDTIVGNNQTVTVKGSRTESIQGGQSRSVGGDAADHVAGAYELHAHGIFLESSAYFQIAASEDMSIRAGGERLDMSEVKHHFESPEIYLHGTRGIQLVAPKIHVFGGEEIHLQVGGSSIHLTGDGIKIKSSGPVEIDGEVVKLNCD